MSRCFCRFNRYRIFFLYIFFLAVHAALVALPSQEQDNSNEDSQLALTASPSESKIPLLREAISIPADAPQASPPFSDRAIPSEFRNQGVSYREFASDFSRALVSFSEVLSGGPQKDGIPALNEPQFIAGSAVSWLGKTESVLVYEGNTVLRVYPVQILTYHEIVNDVVDGLPVAVTYCPLCNTGVAFASVDHEGMPLDFGVSGRLRYSNMIMYDRQSESWWQQATGRSIAGDYTGAELPILPLNLVSWSQAQTLGQELGKPIEVLSRETGHARRYGRNPYPGYDSTSFPFLYRGPELGSDFEPLERVLSVQHNDEWVYFPFSELRESGISQINVAGDSILFVYSNGVSSPLDNDSVAAGSDIGSVQAFLAKANGQALNFTLRTDNRLEDTTTGTIWSKNGVAQSGALAGERLGLIPSINHFWFSWSAFESELNAN